VPVSPADYAEQVRDVRLFLQGKSDELLAGLRTRMQEAARQTQFERASIVRDQIQALDTVLQSQRMVSADLLDQDVIGFHREGIALEVVVLSVRQGKMIGSRAFSFARQEFPDAEILSSFLGLHYDLVPVPPDEVLLPFAIADADVKAEWLSDRRGKKVEILVPARGPRHDLVELARKNAAASFASRRNTRDDAQATLGRLQRRLGLPRLPRVIECYDISHIQGAETVASLVVFVDGQPEKSRYRTYKIRQAESPDDFACMYEVLSRRFRRARESMQQEERLDSWRLPDLLVVDGGKGQLGVALAAARDTGIDVRPGAGLPIVALAKERDTTAPAQAPRAPGTDEKPAAVVPAGPQPDRVFLPQAKDAIPIRANSAEMFVLQRLRDEAHRFAVTFHRSQRKKRTIQSELSRVPGIGPARQRELLRHFGSLKKVREASLADLLAAPGITRKTASALRDYFAAHG
jgi:excinuclease ABC subunit C